MFLNYMDLSAIMGHNDNSLKGVGAICCYYGTHVVCAASFFLKD